MNKALAWHSLPLRVDHVLVTAVLPGARHVLPWHARRASPGPGTHCPPLSCRPRQPADCILPCCPRQLGAGAGPGLGTREGKEPDGLEAELQLCTHPSHGWCLGPQHTAQSQHGQTTAPASQWELPGREGEGQSLHPSSSVPSRSCRSTSPLSSPIEALCPQTALQYSHAAHLA